jgi:hypothetical protein
MSVDVQRTTWHYIAEDITAKPYLALNIGATANYELVVFGYVTVLIFY